MCLENIDASESYNQIIIIRHVVNDSLLDVIIFKIYYFFFVLSNTSAYVDVNGVQRIFE